MVIISRLLSSIRQLKFWILICSLGTGCATTEKEEIVQDDKSKKTKPTHSSLVINGDKSIHHSAPLPSYIPVDNPLYVGEAAVGMGADFLAWDFNRDGRIDMVEKYKSKGKIEFRAFDFNFDGKVDVKVGANNGAHIYYRSGKRTGKMPTPPSKKSQKSDQNMKVQAGAEATKTKASPAKMPAEKTADTPAAAEEKKGQDHSKQDPAPQGRQAL